MESKKKTKIIATSIDDIAGAIEIIAAHEGNKCKKSAYLHAAKIVKTYANNISRLNIE